VEIVWGVRDGDEDELKDIRVIPMHLADARPDGSLRYTGRLCFEANGKFGYGVRILPVHPHLNNRFEMALVKWA
jgi:starch phosphorylase